MSYENRDTFGMYRTVEGDGPGPRLMGANTLIGDDVYNHNNEKLGEIKEIMLNMQSGRISYAVMSYGGFFAIGEKLFAVPWKALVLDTVNKRLTLNIDKMKLENAPGFNSDHWPDMADQTWADSIHSYYETENKDLVSPLF